MLPIKTGETTLCGEMITKGHRLFSFTGLFTRATGEWCATVNKKCTHHHATGIGNLVSQPFKKIQATTNQDI